MNKINATMSSGNMTLAFSETLCLIPKNGLSVKFPVVDKAGKLLREYSINFAFLDSKEKTPADIKTNQSNIDITLFNFGNQLGAGTTFPISFKIADLPIHVLFFGHGLTNNEDQSKKVLLFTVTIYTGGENG